MTRKCGRVGPLSGMRIHLLWLAVWLGTLPPAVSGAPIRDFQSYLRGGPRHWAATGAVEVPAGVHIRNRRGELKDNRVVNYLTWVRDLNARKFDRIHPVLGPMLASHAAQTSASSTSVSSHVTTTQAQVINTPQKTTIVLPHVALEELTPPVPSSGSYYPPIAQEISKTSVVTTNVFPGQQQDLEGSPEAIPEPSTVALTLLLFGTVGCWSRWR